MLMEAAEGELDMVVELEGALKQSRAVAVP